MVCQKGTLSKPNLKDLETIWQQPAPMKQILQSAFLAIAVVGWAAGFSLAADQGPLFGAESTGEFEVTITDQPADTVAPKSAALETFCKELSCPNTGKTVMQPAADPQQP